MRSRTSRIEPVVYGCTAAILWFIPLLNRLHVESMAVLALIAFFVAGGVAHRALGSDSDGRAYARVLASRLAWLLLPAGMLTVSMLWAPNCDYFRGLIFFFLFPVITTIFSVSLAWALASRRIRFRFQILIGVLVVVLAPIFDIGLHPQFYTYNHVFGGVLGPIYDEALVIRPGLFTFRLLTLLWSGMFCTTVRFRVYPGRRIGFVTLALLIGGAYLFSGPLGFNTPESYLRAQFSGHHRTEHFDLFFDDETADADRVYRWAVEHEFRYLQLAEQLGTNVGTRIQSYIYPDEEARARLTGARYTSVSPVWLRTPQVHVMASQVGSVFPHELVHVFSREFAPPVIHAPLSIGLVEGLAVALEPPDGRPSSHETVAASDLPGDLDTDDAADRISNTLSLTGFWSGRGGVSYTVMGSFVRYLIDTYGIALFKRAYRTGAFIDLYGKDTRVLAREWVDHLRRLPKIDRSAARRARARFSVPSLFERICPHWIPVEVRRYEKAVDLFNMEGPDAARQAFFGIMEEWPTFLPARTGWTEAMLALGEQDSVLARFEGSPFDELLTSEIRAMGDAFSMSGRPDSARVWFEEARNRYPVYSRESRARLTLRRHSARSPELIHILVSADSVGARLIALDELLEEPETPDDAVASARVWRALLLAEDNRFSEARKALEKARKSRAWPDRLGTDGELLRQFDIWSAVYAYRDGDIERAIAYARKASGAFEEAGDTAAATLMADFESRLRWISAGANGINIEKN